MIRFSCHCGHKFEVDDDQAGGDVQCTACGLLNDVPHLGDLPTLAEDGTFRVAEPLPREPGRVGRLSYIYQRGTTDRAGEEIDLRRQPEDDEGLGGEAADIDLARPSRVDAPRYDPETGELIRAIDVREGYAYIENAPPAQRPAPAPVIPFAEPALRYASKGAELGRSHGLLLELFQPGNAAVMASVFIAHVIGGLMHLFLFMICAAFSLAAGFYLPAWPFNLLFWLVVAHYGNTVREMGVEEIDELPRPLGSLAIFDDILAPLFRMLLAVVLCYLPVFWIHSFDAGPHLVALPLLLAGSFLFPAVAMTTLISGSIENLHPGRVLRVIRACGARYLPLAAMWAVLFPIYLLVTLGVDLIGPMFGHDLIGAKLLGKAIIALPLLLTGVYFMHYFCWRLAHLYRLGHERFGWAWEEHQRAMEEARAEKRRGAGRGGRSREVGV